MSTETPDVVRSMKDVAKVLQCSERTVIRWKIHWGAMAETHQLPELRMPVSQIGTAANAPVVADRNELLRWLLRVAQYNATPATDRVRRRNARRAG